MKLNTMYQELPILTSKDIVVNGNDIVKILNRKPGEYIKEIIQDLEINILDGKINNNYNDIEKYIVKKYNN